MKLILSAFLLALSIGCQQKPTVGVTESGVLVQNKDYRKIITANAVVFDTRSPFEFNTNKVPGSVNLPISDFQVSKDPLDAARRLSLYGVNPNTSVVIIGEGRGDEQKLAWEFIKLGVIHIETLKSSVFRMMNQSSEPPKKNVAIWKPTNSYGELSAKELKKKLESYRPNLSKARSKALGGVPGQAIRTRVLVLTMEKDSAIAAQYPYVDHLVFDDQNLFDEKGLLNRSSYSDFETQLKKYDVVILVDSTMQRFAHAYAVVQFGAKSFYLAR